MADLLKQLVKQNVAMDYTGRILAAFSQDAHRLSPSSSNSDFPPGRRPILPLRAGGRIPNSDFPISQPLVEPLTNRELEVLDLLEQRMQNKEIGGKLFISPKTVKKHLDNIYGKLNVNNRQQAVEKAQALGILTR